ncbi:phosphoserine transaminase [soil metagenome]
MVNFTPGPSQLYFTVPDHIKKAFRDGIPSLSHRSKQFENIFAETTQGLKNLLNVPDEYFIVFTGSATEIWERVIQNLVAEKSFHLVNGSFSKRFFEIAQQLNKTPEKIEVPAGSSFTNATVPSGTEVIALTHNETSFGVSLQIPFINSFKASNPESIIVVDAVSSLPYPDFDYTKIDSAFFSVQKGFGLPAGLGVWMLNKRCLEKAQHLLSGGHSIGSYHSLPLLCGSALKNQTPETPNVLGIYLLGKVVNDFLQKGAVAIRQETQYKAALLYKALEEHSFIKPFVTQKADRSKTVIVANTGERTEELATYLQARGFFPGDGYGDARKSQLRFANFPAHSKEQFESLADLISNFK